MGLVMVRYGAEPREDLEAPFHCKVWWKVIGEPTWVFAQTWAKARQMVCGKPVEVWRQ